MVRSRIGLRVFLFTMRPPSDKTVQQAAVHRLRRLNPFAPCRDSCGVEPRSRALANPPNRRTQNTILRPNSSVRGAPSEKVPVPTPNLCAICCEYVVPLMLPCEPVK